MSLIIAGVFVTDPALGYSPGTPKGSGGPQSWHGTIHGLNAVLCFGSLTVACFVFARRFAALPGARGWARYSLSMGILQVVLFIVVNVTATLDQNGTLTNPPTGLLQRVGIVTGWIWLSLVALRELRALPQPVPDAADEPPRTATA